MPANHATLVPDFFRALADRKERPTAGDVLHDLAELFEAERMGLTRLDGITEVATGTASVSASELPWHADAGLLDRARNSLSAESHQDKSGTWMLCLVPDPARGESVIAWAFRPGKGWTEADRWQWMFASQALARWRSQSGAADVDFAAMRNRLELAATVTARLIHDFGNYLTGIMGFTELSQSQSEVDGTLALYLREVMQSAQQGADWIRRLHLFCRRGNAPTWPTLLAGALQAEETRVRTAGSNLRWLVELPDDLPLVSMEATALQTAISELVNNVREATRDQGTLTVRARTVELTEADRGSVLGSIEPGHYVEVTIADDGPGFSPDAQAKLFRDIFFSTKPRHRGLGLLVVYGILQRFRGGMKWDAKNGATVQLYVPAVALNVPATQPRSDAAHLLVVHHNPRMLESMRKILETNGWHVTTANSPATALSAVQAAKHAYNLILADVLMPGTSGFEMARKILEHDGKSQFLFVHAQATFHGLPEEELLNQFALLRWPMEAPTFLREVEAALSRAAAKPETGKSAR